jgi:hypothetical protein
VFNDFINNNKITNTISTSVLNTLLLSVHANSRLLLHSTLPTTYLPVLLTHQQAIPLITPNLSLYLPCMTTELSFFAEDIQNSLSIMVTVIQQNNNRCSYINRLLFNNASVMWCLAFDNGSGTLFRCPWRRSTRLDSIIHNYLIYSLSKSRLCQSAFGYSELHSLRKLPTIWYYETNKMVGKIDLFSS